MKKNFGLMAVFFDENDTLSDFSSLSAIKIYNSLADSWELSKTIPYTPNLTLAPAQLRQQ